MSLWGAFPPPSQVTSESGREADRELKMMKTPPNVFDVVSVPSLAQTAMKDTRDGVAHTTDVCFSGAGGWEVQDQGVSDSLPDEVFPPNSRRPPACCAHGLSSVHAGEHPGASSSFCGPLIPSWHDPNLITSSGPHPLIPQWG